MNYQEFLQTKIIEVPRAGFEIEPSELPDYLFNHQKDVVAWALRVGRALIASSFGLGKTRQQCEIAGQLHHRTQAPFLVICPLGIKHQFQAEDGPVLGQDWQYVRNDAEIAAATSPYLITNYERVRDGSITSDSIDRICGVSLDEGSVLRSLGSKTSQTFKDLFANTPYRFVATATPAPNDYKELIYYAEFLGVMDHGQSLTRWFKRDPQKAGHLTLHPQHEQSFWLWVSGWALFLNKPSDLGYSDEGYSLPPLNVHWHRIATDQRRAWEQTDNRGQHRMFLDAAGGVREAAAEKRETLDGRIQKMQEIIQDQERGNGSSLHQWVVWCHLNREQDAIEDAFKATGDSYSSIYGSLDIEEAETRLYQWKRKETQMLVSKPVMLGSGINLQQCHDVVFLGIDYKFQDFIQAIHRCHRFGQTKPVDVHIIYAESEDQVIAVLKNKWQQHDRLVERMRDIIQKYGLSAEAMRKELTRSIGMERQEVKGKLYTAVLNDCVKEMANIESDSVGLIHTSIPFGNHYSYTISVEDFGHNASDAEFWDQMEFLIPDLLRVLKPGRVAAIHVKDRILYGHQTRSGFMEVSPFSDECVTAFRRHGWMYEGRRTIVTDVVRENNSTYRLGWTEMTRDASKMGSGLPEYLLLFRKPPSDPTTARADEPITKTKEDYTRARWQIDAHSFWRSNGNSPLSPDELYDYRQHVSRLEEKDRLGNLPSSFFAEPPVSRSAWVWDDVVYMRTLNTDQSRSRQQNHICPLPFDIVERTIKLYSNEGDLILDPFAGLFTVPYLAIKYGRIGYGVELNPRYFEAGVDYCQKMEQEKTAPTLFDYLQVKDVVKVAGA